MKVKNMTGFSFQSFMSRRCGAAIFVISLFLSLGFSSSLAQESSYASEADLKKNAEKLFKEKDYTGAAPLYSQLVSVYPKDPNFNYKYGICLLFTDKEKPKAVTYLDFAAKFPKTPYDVYFYLGRAYHLNYQFNEAIGNYNEFKNKAKKPEVEKLEVDRQIEMCENGKEIVKTLKNFTTLDKKPVAQEGFFLAYDYTKLGGKVLSTPDNFKSDQDKKKKYNSTMFLSNQQDVIYLSSYGKDHESGLDIHTIEKLSTGEWGVPSELGNTINSPYDEEYPFLTPDGKQLFFCSKGHNSIGGYDIFVSELNEQTRTWSEPKNLGFPVNSTSDDLFYAADSGNTIAFFATNRETGLGKVEVYSIQTESSGNKLALIRGKYISRDNPTLKDAKISVLNAATQELVGVFNTKSENGEYEITVPLGGVYTYVVEAEGYLPHAENIKVPSRVRQSILRQEIRLRKYEKEEEMVVLNYFSSENQEEEQPAAAAGTEESPKEIKSVFKYEDKDKLQPVNVGGQMVMATPPVIPPSGVVASAEKPLGSEKTYSDEISNTDLVKIAYNDAQSAEREAASLENEAKAAWEVFSEKDNLSKMKIEEASAIESAAQNLSDAGAKEAELKRAEALKSEASEKQNEGAVARDIAMGLEREAKAKRDEANEALTIAKELEKASNTPGAVASVKKPVKKTETPSASSKEIASRNAGQLSKESVEDKTRSQEKMTEASRLKQEVEELNRKASEVRGGAESVSDPAVKEKAVADAVQLETEAKQKQEQAMAAFDEATRLQDEAEQKQEQATVAVSVAKEIETKKQEIAPAETEKGTPPVSAPEQPVVTTTPSNETKPADSAPSATPAVSEPATVPAVAEVPKSTTPTIESIREEKKLEAASVRTLAEQQIAQSDSLAIASIRLKEDSKKMKKQEKQDALVRADEMMRESVNIKIEADRGIEKAKNLDAVAADNDMLQAELSARQAVAAAPIAVSTEPTPDSSAPTGETAKPAEKPSAVSTETAAPVSAPASLPDPVFADSVKTVKVQEVQQSKETASRLQQESEELARQSMQARSEANTTSDPAEKQKALDRSNQLNEQSISKQKESEQQLAKAKETEEAIGDPVKMNELVQAAYVEKQLESKTPPAPVETASTPPAETTIPVIPPAVSEPAASGPVTSPQQPETPAAAPSTEPTPASSESPVSQPAAVIAPPEGDEEAIRHETTQRILREAESTKATAQQQQSKSEELARESMNLMREARATSDPAQKNRLMDRSQQLNLESINVQKESESNFAKADDLNRKAFDPAYIAEASKNPPAETTPPVAAATEQPGTPAPATTTPTETVTPSEVPPAAVPATAAAPVTSSVSDMKTVFVKSEEIIYTETNPIPINPPLPEGLIFKVQIGAYRNPIPQDLFKGIQPIIGDRTSGGLTRYSAGIFHAFESANLAKKEIRSLGYRDAFVVAYYNGKRITLSEAYAILNGATSGFKQAYNTSRTDETNALKQHNIYPEKYAPEPADAGLVVFNNPNVAPPVTEIPAPASTPAEVTAPGVSSASLGTKLGLFFTVQVGAYRTSAVPPSLQNISPLNRDETTGGIFRYTSGIYDRFAAADSAKRAIASQSVPDAFVVAFRNGTRIGVNQARSLEGTVAAPTASSASSPVESPAPASQPVAGIVFRVQVGAFRDKVPMNYADYFFKIVEKGLTSKKSDDGITYFYAGNAKDYQSAALLRNEIASAGVPDAFIVAFNGEQKIAVTEAQRLLKQ